ncbi:MAG: S8 family peptidase [Muribaculaceae bacterium]|nr:S8 family peptidase [Muribaculaceae bacterium]
MKRYIPVVLLAGSAIASVAQNKLDLPAREYMERYQARVQQASGDVSVKAVRAAEAETVAAIVTVESVSDLDRLAAMGYDIDYTLSDMAMMALPLADVDSLVAQPWVRQVSFGAEATPLLDKARSITNVDAVQQGIAEGLEQPYTGSGVVVSLYDTGLDPNHINFLNDDGTTRVKGITTVTGTAGVQQYYESARQIASFTTENAAETHGTHVLGIAAGSYKGTASYAGTTGSMPYYGVATDADIVVGCGSLYNTCILKGVKYAVDKSKELGKPAVINLSLGSTTGSHDGLSSFGRQLNEMGKDAIIVVAAGNDGDIPMGLTKQFSEGDTQLKTFPAPYNISTGAINYTSPNYNGTIEIYGSDSRPFKCSIVIYSRKGLSYEITDQYTIESSTAGKRTYIGGSSTGSQYVKLTNFDAASSATSYMDIASNIDTYSNRYSVIINHTLDMRVESTRSYIGIIIEGEPGQRVNMYANCTNQASTGVYSTFIDRYIDGWTAGSPDGSINDMACGDNIIAIGSFNTRKSWPLITGTVRRYTGSGYDEGKISGFSSYGTMRDGSTLPDVAAPGCGIISSVSGYYSKLNESAICGMEQTGARKYHWDNMQGTSMAAPFAAGVFALWLEADPTLTIADIKSIVKATALRDSYVNTDAVPAHWGAGKLDALEGIKEVIRRKNNGGVNGITVDDRGYIMTPAGEKAWDIVVDGASNVEATLYNLQGIAVARAAGENGEVTLDASSCGTGVYLLTITTPNSAPVTRKVRI